MAAASDRRGSDLLTFRAKRLPIKTAQINRARESTHDAVCCGQVSPVLAPLYGPAVRCKLNLMIWRRLVLRFCIRPLNGAFVLLAIMDIRAHPISF
jgi:hypothetical protein